MPYVAAAEFLRRHSGVLRECDAQPATSCTASTVAIDLDQAATATQLERPKAEALTMAVAAIAFRPALNHFTVFCETWHPSLAALSDEDFEAAWCLADYWMLDEDCTTALAQEAVQRASRYLLSDCEYSELLNMPSPPQLSIEHWAAAAPLRAAQGKAFALAHQYVGHPFPLDIARGDLTPTRADARYYWYELLCAALWGQQHALLLAFHRDATSVWGWVPVSSGAAAGGHISLLLWARSQGCPLDRHVSDVAARFGQLALLQWAHGNGLSSERAHI
jgi:hypothetical protein